MLPEGKPQLVLNVPLCTGEGVIFFSFSLSCICMCLFVVFSAIGNRGFSEILAASKATRWSSWTCGAKPKIRSFPITDDCFWSSYTDRKIPTRMMRLKVTSGAMSDQEQKKRNLEQICSTQTDKCTKAFSIASVNADERTWTLQQHPILHKCAYVA